jgi:sporadic carbohydrate cluster 2OG-Fe(II) oxygenase
MEKKITNELINKGYFKFKLNQKIFREIHKSFTKKVKHKVKKKINLNKFHESYYIENLNFLRMKLFSDINKDKIFKKKIFLSSKKYIENCVGSEICASDLNLSIQFPNDDSSLLDMHSDFFSGESIFQVNLWIPLEEVKKTQSMFIIDPIESIKILRKIKDDINIDFKKINKIYKSKMKWIKLKKGEAMLFSPNCLHGNVVNQEKNTRWSFNIRYKNLYSPYPKVKNEKKIGTFYKPISIKAISKFNLTHNFDEIIGK